MKNKLWVGAATLTLTAAGLVVLPSTAQAARPMAPAPTVVTLSMQGDQAVVSPATVRPGVVEFHVASTFIVPGDEGGPDPLAVILTDNLAAIVGALPSVFGDPSDPLAAAASAQAMRTIHGAGTFYGGGTKGTVWQVRLNPGSYSVLGAQSTAMGLAKPGSFTVEGAPRAGSLHATQATVRAVGPVGKNKWTFTQRGSRPVTWLRFTNRAHELHFMDMAGVKPGTSDADVKKAFQSDGNPTFFTNQGVSFDVVSPGVTVAIKAAVPPGRYLLTCFIPSETDGMPHSLMGMWKLVDVR